MSQGLVSNNDFRNERKRFALRFKQGWCLKQKVEIVESSAPELPCATHHQELRAELSELRAKLSELRAKKLSELV